MVKISVIIPNYNNAKFLKKSISSVYDQSLKDIETICIDDGSTDDSLKVLDELKQEFSTLKVISQENQGQGNARNAGLKIAAGEYVAFLDSDDVFIDENALERMYELAKKENLNMVTANLAFVDRKYKIKRENSHEFLDCLYINEYGVIDTQSYGIPHGFAKSIFNLNFLSSRDITFPDVFAGENNIFLANVLVNTSKIGAVPLNLYGYNNSVGGRLNKKINTYDRKRQHMAHFKMVCDILSNGDFDNASNEYKNYLFKYLISEKNVSDVDLFRSFKGVFNDCGEDYFDDANENYIKFIILYKTYLLKHSSCEQLFDEIKNEFSQYHLEFMEDIDLTVVKMYLLVINSDSLDDFKLRHNKFTLKELENEQKQLKIKNKQLKDEKRELNAELKKIERLNDELFDSSSWKVTKFLR